jgi:hypothetical protein
LIFIIFSVHISADLDFSDRERDALSQSSGGSDAGRTGLKNGRRLVFTTSLVGVQFGLYFRGLPTLRYSHFPYHDTSHTLLYSECCVGMYYKTFSTRYNMNYVGKKLFDASNLN